MESRTKKFNLSRLNNGNRPMSAYTLDLSIFPKHSLRKSDKALFIQMHRAETKGSASNAQSIIISRKTAVA